MYKTESQYILSLSDARLRMKFAVTVRRNGERYEEIIDFIDYSYGIYIRWLQ